MKNKLTLLLLIVSVCTIPSVFSYSETADPGACISDPDMVACQLLKTYDDRLLYNEVSWLTSHNSFAYKNDPPVKSSPYLPNQVLNITQQLEYGVRSFMLDIHFDANEQIILAHGTSYHFFASPFVGFLKTIKKWLDDHPEDIITLHLESYVKNYSRIMDAISDADLDTYLYHDKPNKVKWPTLGELRRKNTRLIVFSDTRRDTGPGIMHTGKYMETRYNLAQYPNCEKRTDNRSTTADLFVLNHFYALTILRSQGSWFRIYINDAALTWKFWRWLGLFGVAADTNSKVNKRITKCYNQENKWPNFVAMDFVGATDEERNVVKNINLFALESLKNTRKKIPTDRETGTLISLPTKTTIETSGASQ